MILSRIIVFLSAIFSSNIESYEANLKCNLRFRLQIRVCINRFIDAFEIYEHLSAKDNKDLYKNNEIYISKWIYKALIQNIDAWKHLIEKVASFDSEEDIRNYESKYNLFTNKMNDNIRSVKKYLCSNAYMVTPKNYIDLFNLLINFLCINFNKTFDIKELYAHLVFNPLLFDSDCIYSIRYKEIIPENFKMMCKNKSIERNVEEGLNSSEAEIKFDETFILAKIELTYYERFNWKFLMEHPNIFEKSYVLLDNILEIILIRDFNKNKKKIIELFDSIENDLKEHIMLFEAIENYVKFIENEKLLFPKDLNIPGDNQFLQITIPKDFYKKVKATSFVTKNKMHSYVLFFDIIITQIPKKFHNFQEISFYYELRNNFVMIYNDFVKKFTPLVSNNELLCEETYMV